MTPVPVRATLSGLVLAFVVNLSVSERFPRTVGVKVTVTLQEAAGARVEPQVVLETEKFVPVTTATEVIFRVEPPVFVRFTVQGLSETLQLLSGELTAAFPKAAVVKLKEITGGPEAPRK